MEQLPPTQEALAAKKLDDFLSQFDLDDQERLIRYALDHVVPRMKRLSPPQPAVGAQPLPAPQTVEQAIGTLVSALAESKGWLRDYADALIRDAIDRRHCKPVGTITSDVDDGVVSQEVVWHVPIEILPSGSELYLFAPPAPSEPAQPGPTGWIVEHGAVSLPLGHPSRITVKNFYESPTDAAKAYEEAKREFDSIFYPVFKVTIPQAADLTDEAIEWAWRYGWRACRDAETVGFDSENTEWGFAAANVIARTLRINALPPQIATPPAPSEPAQPVPAGAHTYLCRAWGEADLPVVAIVRSRDEVRQFYIDQWLGDENDAGYDGTPTLPGLMQEFDEHDWHDEPEITYTFEIGGVSVERVFA